MTDAAPALVELAFLTVPPPRSGHVVDLLRNIPAVSRAAAVYSGVDVVAVLEGTAEQIDSAHKDILSRGAPIEQVEPFPVDVVLPGLSFNSNQDVLRSSCGAFVRCETRTDEVTVDYAATILAKLPGVRRLYLNHNRSEVILDVISADKGFFDDAVMSTIQGQWSVVKSTRTLITINEMSWERLPSGDAVRPLIFVSLSKGDLAFGTALCRRLALDTGLMCWTFSDIPVGAGSWPTEVDKVIAEARLHVFLLSTEALASPECQREFGKVDAIAAAQDVCCVLLPGCEISQLPLRYQERQCLKADDFFAYARLLEWTGVRLQS